jgi:hypothetical protein
VMEPVSLILAAIVAGVSAGALDELKDEAKEKAKLLYGKLRALLGQRFQEAGTANAEGALADYEEDPETYEKGLSKKLTAAGADQDAVILAAARELLDLVGQSAASSAKFNVNVTRSKGVQVGDGNTQTNTFH